MKEKLSFKDLPDPGNRYVLEECLGAGVYGKVYRAKDMEAGGKYVAIKVQRLNEDTTGLIQEEYKILRDFTQHPNLPEFYGIYKSNENSEEKIWFVMELCEGGPVIDLVNGLMAANRRIAEEHIAFVLKEVVKALIYLHQNKVIHRDIRGSNILLTRDGEVKLVDFGLSKVLKTTLGKTNSCLGSPDWMAPEVITSSGNHETDGYDNRADVWSLGILTLELANGRSPFQGMHPSRALFQITRNPPPTLDRPEHWSETFNDFVNECLVKNPEHRPYIMELLEHPFLTEVPENNYYLTQELKGLCQSFSKTGTESRTPEVAIQSSMLKRGENEHLEQMLVEDLATLDEITEEVILQELQNRMVKGKFCTFIGDILLVLNPNEQPDIFGEQQHRQYQFKSRSDHAPHIYSVADSAYQAALHHETTQHILLAGESSSGKTTNYLHIIDHLLYLGQNKNINQERIKDAIKLIHAFVHASTPTNDYSTRCVLHTEIIYGSSGKNTGARFKVSQIEKWRVSSTDMLQPNFHILYYFYDGIEANGELNKYQLNADRTYRYLRVPEDSKFNSRPRDNPKQNVKKYQKIQEIFNEFEFTDEQVETVLNTLAAIINLGEVRFHKTPAYTAELDNEEYAVKVAKLLKVDEKKFVWALTNYCVISEGTALRKSHSCEEARDARDVLANTLYSRVVQYIVSVINNKLAYGMAIFGEKYSVKTLDFYGFECFKENNFSQFLINCTNEQFQYHYLQRVFGWEALETNEENIPYKPFYYYNNKDALEEMLGKHSVLSIIDDASRQGRGGKYVLERLQNPEKVYINKINGAEFCVSHYIGKVTYDSKEMPDRNRDFLPPEIIEILRSSDYEIIKLFFKSKLGKTGTIGEEPSKQSRTEQQFSQTRKMRTAASTFKAFSIELLKELSIGAGAGGTHFVRCIRSDLRGSPRGFHKEIIKQQLRAMAAVETAEARKKGFPHRISFSEFLRRYKFLAFDFNENVDINKDNCRLLLVRLKIEGWVIGRTKVLLKYYNEEYLSRLYETQVKKVIKIQSMIRSYLARRKILKELKTAKKVERTQELQNQDLSQEEKEDAAAIVVQKAYRKYSEKKTYGNFSSEQYDEELIKFIRIFYNKWKSKSVFQVLLQYRAARYQDLYNLSQQVHLYNQKVMNALQQYKDVDLDRIDPQAQVDSWLGSKKPSVLKLPFRLEDVPYFDTSYMCDPLSTAEISNYKEEAWDAPFRWRENISSQITSSMLSSSEGSEVTNKSQNQLIELPYSRNPSEPVRCLASPGPDFEEEKQDESDENFKSNTTETQLDLNNITSTPANKDFEYIKAPVVKKSHKIKPAPINPVVELEIRGLRNSSATEDDPPYNFQAMLRKTNFQRESIKRSDDIKEYSFKKRKEKDSTNTENDNINLQKTSPAKHVPNKRNIKGVENNREKEDGTKETKPIVTFCEVLPSTEIAPGVFLEGTVVEL